MTGKHGANCDSRDVYDQFFRATEGLDFSKYDYHDCARITGRDRDGFKKDEYDPYGE